MTAFAALADALGQLEAVIRPLTSAEFTRRDMACSGSIGAHVRHCLDHVWALERGLTGGTLCYDSRERDTVVEQDTGLARSQLRRAIARLGGLSADLLDRPLTFVGRVHEDGRVVHSSTTVAREVAYVISHTVHHSALIAVLLEQAACDVPPRFGLAPGTPTFRPQEGACAR